MEASEVQELRRCAAGQVGDWQILIATCKLTPRLEKRIQSTIHIYKETVDQRNLDVIKSGQNLLTLLHAVEDHWKQIFDDPNKTACMFKHMLIFRIFLKGKLLDDYVGQSHVINENVVCLGQCNGELNDRKRAAREFDTELEHLDGIYQQRVVTVLDELMLDRAHVESKMNAASARDGQPGSDIQPLINRCDWASLAAALVKDQRLMVDLFPKGDDRRRKIQHGISQIQKKYFRRSNGPHMLSAKCATYDNKDPASNFCVTAPPRYSDLYDGVEDLDHDQKANSRKETSDTWTARIRRSGKFLSR